MIFAQLLTFTVLPSQIRDLLVTWSDVSSRGVAVVSPFVDSGSVLIIFLLFCNLCNIHVYSNISWSFFNLPVLWASSWRPHCSQHPILRVNEPRKQCFGSGSRRAKNDPQKLKKLRNFMSWSAGYSLLRAEGFSCSLFSCKNIFTFWSPKSLIRIRIKWIRNAAV